jgi:hypothetical protein
MVCQFDWNTYFLGNKFDTNHVLCKMDKFTMHQYMLNGSPLVVKITRGKTHELMLQTHGKVVTWTNQIKQTLYLGR